MKNTTKGFTRALCEAVADLARSFAVAKYAPANSVDFIDLCIEWGEAFETRNANRKWDGEFLQEVEAHFHECYRAWVSKTNAHDRHLNPSRSKHAE